MKALALLWLSFLFPAIMAQIPAEYELAYRRLCVHVERPAAGGREVGSGMVMKRLGDSLLIATARHVVQDLAVSDPPPRGHVSLYGSQVLLPYRVVYLDDLDLAFLKVRMPTMLVAPPPAARDADLDAPLWLMAARTGYEPMPRGFDGRILYRSSKDPFFWSAIAGASQGDSGSLIISRKGLVGMLLGGGDELKCLSIGYIMDRMDQLTTTNR
ncbi:MAG TPA: trypsin-like peptidase domain-containing protein [Flavobacteriales bacterium]|nr:trypsin-like peptidase domain-containing protein [Flavobacteriales bacterium]HNU57227.1 trypsin-like peptidase domain-containing protein [Flavobacteriales bacterium]